MVHLLILICIVEGLSLLSGKWQCVSSDHRLFWESLFWNIFYAHS